MIFDLVASNCVGLGFEFLLKSAFKIDYRVSNVLNLKGYAEKIRFDFVNLAVNTNSLYVMKPLIRKKLPLHLSADCPVNCVEELLTYLSRFLFFVKIFASFKYN